MTPTIEKVIEIVRQLPPPDREKFFDWAEAEKSKELLEKESKNIEFKEKNDRFRKALKWIEEHKEEFDGQWACLDGDILISHGFDGKKVFEEAKAKGIETPFMERVKAKELPFGGW